MPGHILGGTAHDSGWHEQSDYRSGIIGRVHEGVPELTGEVRFHVQVGHVLLSGRSFSHCLVGFPGIYRRASLGFGPELYFERRNKDDEERTFRGGARRR